MVTGASRGIGVGSRSNWRGRRLTYVDKPGKFELDIVVNNTAIAPNLPLADTTPEVPDSVYSVNLRGPVALVHALLPHVDPWGP